MAWAGLGLAAQVDGCDAELVLLFALFHDSQRLNEYEDPEHGLRGGRLAQEMSSEGALHLGGDRPELCDFTSDAYYEGRLEPAPVTATRSIAAGNGPVWLEVAHDHRGQSSVEEAEDVAAAVTALVGSPFTEEDGSTRPLREADILVVAPYNAQVRTLRSRLPTAVQVGTVDKFQGQQAPVVVVSMASSTAENAPRGLGFAFDRHRFNVATSRAQCRAVLACTPALLDADCKTIEQMRLVSAVCWFVELATYRRP